MNAIGSSKNLINLCVNALYDQGKAIVDRVGNSEKKQHQAQSTLHYLIKVLKLWNSTNIVQQYKHEEWKVCIQDLSHTADSITFTLSFHSPTEFRRFEAFLRHLNSNWFRDIKAQKLDNGYLSFVVTHPIPVFLNIFPQRHANVDEPLVLSTSASSHVATVSRIIRRLLKDFCLCVQNESVKLSEDLKEKYETKETRSQSTDEYPAFQKTGNDTVLGDFYYNLNTPSEVLLEQLKQAYTSALNANQKAQFKEQRLPFEPSLEVKRLLAEIEKLKKIIESWSYEKEAKTEELELQVNKLKKKCKEMAMTLAQKDTEIQETLLELGRLNVELTSMQNERKRDELFTKTYKRQSASTQTLEIPEWSTTSLDTRTPDNQSTSTEMNRADDGNNQHEHHHGQESINETACLSDVPRTSVDGSIYNNYKLLFLRIAGDLLSDDVRKLKQWVETEFQIDTSGDVNAILLELDRKKIISITDLSRLRRFFETSPRYDFVCLIDSFLLGDYEQLKKTSRSRGSSNRGANSQNGLASQRFAYRPQWPPQAAARGSYTAMSHGPADQSRDNARKFQGVPRANAREPQIGDHRSVTTPNTTHRPDTRNGLASRKAHIVALQRPTTSASRARETIRSINNTTQQQGVVVTDGGTREQHEVQASDSTVRGDQGSNTTRYTNPGSNGQKLSKFQRPDDDDDSRWLCSHYKRHCYVKFECCNKFWPCHRCHNNQSTCGRRKLKSRDTVQVKCAACNQEQPFAQYCSRCNAKFARYFCGLCKHLTGTDDNPYHCEKCGICRIHGDRSFHCDVCGVCLDVQLRGNHKCRAGSAHDECCICLEDAFTGCQILPCSHKVHKECATQMIRSGITRCPICRESFAHKLERRPFKKPP